VFNEDFASYEAKLLASGSAAAQHSAPIERRTQPDRTAVPSAILEHARVS